MGFCVSGLVVDCRCLGERRVGDFMVSGTEGLGFQGGRS